MTDTKTDEKRTLQRGDIIKLAVSTLDTLSTFLGMMHTHGLASRGVDEYHRTHINFHEFDNYEQTLNKLFETFKSGMLDAAIALEDQVNYFA